MHRSIDIRAPGLRLEATFTTARISYPPLDKRLPRSSPWSNSALVGKYSVAPLPITLIDPNSQRQSHFAPFRTYRRAILALAMAIAPQWRWCL